MRLDGIGVLISGGASGLGEATARLLVERGARVAIADLNDEKAEALAAELGDAAHALHADVTDEAQVEAAVAGAREALGELRLAVGCAGVGWAERTVSKRGPAQLQPFETVVRVNLIGMFNLLRLSAAAMNDNEPGTDGERGAVIMTASIAAYDGQAGQTAYAASKGGVVGLTLPAARDLSSIGVRVCTIAPGLVDTPMLAGLPEEARKSLAAGIPFPKRLAQPADFARLALGIIEHGYLNGEVIRMDGALRMAPK